MAIPEGLYRSYSGSAVPTTLSANISDSTQTITVQDGSSFPQAASARYAAIIINEGGDNEEVVYYSDRTGNVLQNCIRGWESLAHTHSAGESVKHVYTALDAREANEHYANPSATFVPHAQHIHKTVAQTIPANHTWTGALNFNGTNTFNGTSEFNGNTHVDSLAVDTIIGPVSITGIVTWGDTPGNPKIITPSSTASQGTSKAPMRSDAQVPLDVKAFLRAFTPAGTIRAWAGSNLPTGIHAGEWDWADGGAISATAFPEYYANVGTSHGGTAANPNKPNLSGRVPVGVDSAHALGNTGGSLTRQLTGTELPVHKHFISDPGHKHNMDGDGGNRYVITNPGPNNNTLGGPGNPGVSFSDIDPSTTGITETQTTGSGQAFNIEQPWAAIRYIVKVH